MVIRSEEKLKLGGPSNYRGRIRAASFGRIIKEHRDYYRSQMTDPIGEALREYLVQGKASADTSYEGTRQAFRSRLIYYIAAWEKAGSLMEKDFN